jgi:Nucleotide modification associated domain 5
MSVTRISAALRDHVVKGLLRHRFNAEQLVIDELLVKAEEVKARRLATGYGTVYTVAESAELLKKRSWFRNVQKVKVQVEEEGVQEVHFSSSLPVPYEHGRDYSPGVAAIIKADCDYLKLKVEEDAIREDAKAQQQQLKKDLDALYVRAVSVIESVTTVKRLIEVWPEVQDFLPEENAGPQGGVPAVLVADLNSAFNLKKVA